MVSVERPERKIAKQIAENETDTTDSRDSSRSSTDSLVGNIGEAAFLKFCREQGLSFEIYDGYEYDVKVNGITVEVKTRDYTQTGEQYNDCLIRDRKDTDWTPDDVDIVVQVMINGEDTETAFITGYCYGSEAADAPFFKKAQTYRTRKVNHSSLKSIDKLLNSEF